MHLLVESSCQSLRAINRDTRCTSDGLYEPVQCDRAEGGALDCHCAHPMTGEVIPNTMRRNVTSINGLFDCHSHGIVKYSIYYCTIVLIACVCSFIRLPLTTYYWPPDTVASWRSCTPMQPYQLLEVCMHLWQFILHFSTRIA